MNSDSAKTASTTLLIMDAFSKRYADISTPEVFREFILDQEQNNHQLNRLGTGEPLYDFLQREASQKSHVRAFLREYSRLVQRIDYQALLQLDEVG